MFSAKFKPEFKTRKMDEFILKYSKWFPYCETENLIKSMRSDLMALNETSKKLALNIADVMPILNNIAELLDAEIEKTPDENKEQWNKICNIIELMHSIAEDNSMFIRN